MAQYGLGENSPVKLTLGKDNYEALIGRHGQWVRWRQSARCSCVQANNQPDIRCTVCKGTGFVYSHQKSGEKTLALTVGNGNVCSLPDGYEDDTVIEVVDFRQEAVGFERCGNFIIITGDGIRPGDIVTARIKKVYERKIGAAVLEHAGGGFYRVPGCRSVLPTTSGVWYTSPGDIVSVESVTAGGTEVAVREKRQDMLLLDIPEGSDGAVTAKNVVWVPPFRFLVLAQNFSKIDAKIIETTGGDAVMTYPYGYDVADGDTITVLSGCNRQKDVVIRAADGESDTVNAFFVADIDRIFSVEAGGGRCREYEKGVDFALAGTNTVLWLSDNRPAADTAYSIVYDVYPTYTVIQSLPGLRTSEDQRIPRRVVLKLLAGYAENKRVNQQ